MVRWNLAPNVGSYSAHLLPTFQPIDTDAIMGIMDDLKSKEASSISRDEFLKLPKTKRDEILQEQAKALEAHYSHASDWDVLETEGWR